MVTASIVDFVLERIFSGDLQPTILLVGVGTGRDVEDLITALVVHSLGPEDVTIFAVDVVEYQHKSEYVRKVQGTGVDDIPISLVDCIGVSWANGLTHDHDDRPFIVLAETKPIKGQAPCRRSAGTATEARGSNFHGGT
jgi:hypothetical protein